MSGHSKWHNIQGRKNAQDAMRGKVFQKLSREIYMAAKSGGPDPSGNPTLRMVMDKARAANMPKTNIERAIKKAEGNSDEHYDEITYEGYAPGGVAVLVEALTDNKNRTASDVRVAFTRNGGSLGATGSVAYMFDRKGYLVIDRSTTDADEDQVLLDVMDAGGDFVNASGLDNKDLGKYRPKGTGIDETNLMSAHDTALLAYRLIHDYPKALEISSLAETDFDGQRIRNWNCFK